MAQSSKYSDKQLQPILNDLIYALEKHKTPTDLSLIAIGNLVSNLLHSSVPENQRKTIAEAFSRALLQSVK